MTKYNTVVSSKWDCPYDYSRLASGLYASFVSKGKAQRHFLFGKGHPMRKFSRGPRQRPGGTEAIAFVASMKYQTSGFICNNEL